MMLTRKYRKSASEHSILILTFRFGKFETIFIIFTVFALIHSLMRSIEENSRLIKPFYLIH